MWTCVNINGNNIVTTLACHTADSKCHYFLLNNDNKPTFTLRCICMGGLDFTSATGARPDSYIMDLLRALPNSESELKMIEKTIHHCDKALNGGVIQAVYREERPADAPTGPLRTQSSC